MDVTDIAQKKIRQQLTKRGKGIGIRIGIETTGCSGYAYKLEFADNILEDDKTFLFDEFAIIVDPKSLLMVENIIVDYQKQGLNEGFEFINPLEKARCGCGESFTV